MTTESDGPATRSPKLISIDQILHAYARPQTPVASTRERGWTGVTVDVHRQYANLAETLTGLDHHLISFCPTGSAKLTQIRDSRTHTGVMKAGASLIMPAGHPSAWEGEAAPSVRLRVPLSLVDVAAEQLGNRATPSVEIRSIFGIFDPVIARLAQAFTAEMELTPHPCQKLIVDALSAAVAAHLLRRYNSSAVDEPSQTRALGKLEMARLSSFIEDNLDQSISLDDLANQVNVSRFHFCRIFKQSTGMTASSYIEQCRIRRAKVLIVETNLPLAEISLVSGFADQSHFTRRFHFHVGCTPAIYAREYGCRRPNRRMAVNEI